MFNSLPSFHLITGASTVSGIMSIVSKGVIALGSFVAAWGAVELGQGIRESNGPGISKGLGGIVGGAVIIAAAVYFKSIDI